MKKIILCISTLALLAIACQKLENNIPLNGDEMAPAVKMITETISGSRGVETKATIADANASFAWTAGDNVAVHVSSVSNVSNGKFVYTSDEGASGAAPDTDNPAKASFTVVYPADYSRDAFAVYPSTIVAEDGLSGSTLNVTLRPSYTLAEVSGETGETSPCPMIADNTGASWSFYQLCSLLRLTVNNIPPSTKRLEIDFNGNKVCGAFSIANPEPGTSSIATIATEDNDVITITNSGETLFGTSWGDGKVFNIPLPVGEYNTNITVRSYSTLEGGEPTLTVTYPFNYTASNTKGKKLTVSLPVFSVSASKRVIFAPGNLQATTTDKGSHWTWHFAAHQYDYIGNATANNKINGPGTVSESGTVDLFQRSTNEKYGISNYDSSVTGGVFNDWGTMNIDGKGVNYWRTPTTAKNDATETDWKYVLRTRSTGVTIGSVPNARYSLAKITIEENKSVNGLIIIPDKFVVGNIPDINWGTINTYSSWSTECSIDDWTKLESAGCVFLPITARRSGSNFYDTDKGNYHGTEIYQVKFGSSQVTTNVSNYGGAYAVRLVHDIQ